jgi:hypothetical protein
MSVIGRVPAFLIVALSGVAISDAPAQRPPLSRNGLRGELVGCYALYTSRAGEAERALYNASALVRLDSQPIDYPTPGVARAMIPLTPVNLPTPPQRPRPYSPRWWADSLSDTVRLSFIDGFSGAVFVLAAPPGRPDTLTGRRFESWDFGPMETTHGPARAIRRPCPAPGQARSRTGTTPT